MSGNQMNMPGPGNEATWGSCTGHPHDPRTEQDEEDEDSPGDFSEEDAHILEMAEYYGYE